jgi:hypothetical protein
MLWITNNIVLQIRWKEEKAWRREGDHYSIRHWPQVWWKQTLWLSVVDVYKKFWVYLFQPWK